MPDITMCANKLCNKKEKCYRFMAEPSEYQSYAMFESDGCEFFMILPKQRKDYRAGVLKRLALNLRE